MRRKCALCGELVNEFDMMTFNTGRVKYVCWDCFKKGQYEAAKSEIGRRNRLEKYWATGYKNK